jgi:hypothetical protein
VSCYAFFEWWLPLSQHPSCPGPSTSFYTERALRGLIRRSWAVSLSATELISRSLTPGRKEGGIRSSVRLRRMQSSLAGPALYLRPHRPRLALKLFRGEPAITQLDWNFTTSHGSSAVFSTNVGSDLHRVSPLLHPVHG